MSSPIESDQGVVPHIAHEEFRRGLPHGHFRLVVNPRLARSYVVRRTRINAFALAVIGGGAALALAGQALPGAALVVLGIVASRLVRHQSGSIVVHLAGRDAAVYADVTSNGVMEVRRARDPS